MSKLSQSERTQLLEIARQSLSRAVRGNHLPQVAHSELSEQLIEPGASFVTLTIDGQLRGCIGTLSAYQPLVNDVIEHAAASGVNDYRFSPVTEDELPLIQIEISRLTTPQKLEYFNAGDLIAKLRPGIDGVIVSDGRRKATFLPQVWEQIPDPRDFLDHLCHKMGASPDLWKKKKLEVQIYQVEEFHE